MHLAKINRCRFDLKKQLHYNKQHLRPNEYDRNVQWLRTKNSWTLFPLSGCDFGDPLLFPLNFRYVFCSETEDLNGDRVDGYLTTYIHIEGYEQGAVASFWSCDFIVSMKVFMPVVFLVQEKQITNPHSYSCSEL